MRVVVVGAGEVGQYLAGFLADGQHDVTIIDTDAEKLSYLGDQMDLKTLEGSGTCAAVLEEAEVDKADALLALTDNDEVNMLVAYFGKRLGAKATVARINSDDAITGHPQFYRQALGVDLVISPARLAAAEATALIQAGGGSGIAEFGFGRVHLRPFKIGEGSLFTRKPISELHLPGALIVAIAREGEVLVPGGKDTIQAGDRIFVICKPEAVQYVIKGVGEKSDKVRQVIIVGGGSVGEHIARYFDSQRYSVKLFEANRRRAWELAEELRYVRVIDSDGGDEEVLEEEYIEHVEALVAATGSDETNIMTAVLAKDHGVPITVAVVDKPQFAELGKKLGLSATLAPRILVAEQVLAFLRGGNVNRLSLIAEGKAEVLEFQVAPGSKLAGKTLIDLKLPRGIIVGAVIRGGKAIIPKGTTEIRVGDSAVLFAVESQISYVESLYGHEVPEGLSNVVQESLE